MDIPYANPREQENASAQLDCIESPVGTIAVMTWQDRLVYSTIGPGAAHQSEAWGRQQGLVPSPARLGAVRTALQAYFQGNLNDSFSPLPLLFISGTDFQRRVWAALAEIRPGTTTTYGMLAKRLNRPRAVRAVGRSVGANPLAVFLPCHRVVGSLGHLTGFACGIPVKRQLLVHENVPMSVNGRVREAVTSQVSLF